MQIFIDSANVKVENDKFTINLIPKQFATLTFLNKVKLSTLKPRDEFKLGDEIFIVLEQTENGTRVIAKEFAYSNVGFGDCNDWRKSTIRTKLLGQEYYKKICDIVGKDNIIPMVRDLTSLDGLDDYGSCSDVVSLLTATEYIKYHKILGLKSHYPDSWWLITPASTPSNDYTRNVCYVNSNGVPNWNDCDWTNGVRPFINLKSSIFVFENKK